MKREVVTMRNVLSWMGLSADYADLHRFYVGDWGGIWTGLTRSTGWISVRVWGSADSRMFHLLKLMFEEEGRKMVFIFRNVSEK
jgi:hypothetical protein